MAKIVDQLIPPGLQELWAKLNSPNSLNATSPKTIRAKKANRKPNKKKRRNLDLIAMKNLALIVQQEYFIAEGKTPPPDFVHTLVQDLILGIINPEYFRQCKLDYQQTLESVPDSLYMDSMPPYGWRSPTYLPSVSAWPNGIVTTEPPGYFGEKVSTVINNLEEPEVSFFADKWLRWRRLVFKSKNTELNEGAARMLMRWNCTVSAQATTRGSKPMFSLNLRAALASFSDSVLTTNEPPTHNRSVFYWRFKLPPSTPPFYASYQVRRETKVLSRILKKSGSGLYERYVLDAGVRPLLGRGFNNNNSVEMSISGDPELWEIKPPCLLWSLASGNAWTWQEADGHEWQCELLTPRFQITVAKIGVAYLTLRLSDGVDTNDIVFSQVMSGNWDWAFDNSGTEGDGALPKYEDVRVTDVSCYGDVAVLHIKRSPLPYTKAARGFLKLQINSPTTAVLSTFADTADCNALDFAYTVAPNPQGQNYIRQILLPRHTIWAFFDAADEIKKVQLEERALYPETSSVGSISYALFLDADLVSEYIVSQSGVSNYQAALDGFNDSGHIGGWYFAQHQLDRNKTGIKIFPVWNSRFTYNTDPLFYSGTAPLAGETEHPQAYVGIEPVILSSKVVRLSLTYYHRIPYDPPGLMNFGSPQWFIKTHVYWGKKVTPAGVAGIVEKEVF